MTVIELTKDVRFLRDEYYDIDDTVYYFGYIECKNGSGISYTIRKINNDYHVCAYVGGYSSGNTEESLIECISYNDGIDYIESVHSKIHSGNTKDNQDKILEF